MNIKIPTDAIDRVMSGIVITPDIARQIVQLGLANDASAQPLTVADRSAQVDVQYERYRQQAVREASEIINERDKLRDALAESEKLNSDLKIAVQEYGRQRDEARAELSKLRSENANLLACTATDREEIRRLFDLSNRQRQEIAALKARKVTLPPSVNPANDYHEWCNEFRDQCIAAIRAAGVEVENA